MSHDIDDQGASNNVVQLECARFEEGLASEVVDRELELHRETCDRCDDLARAHQALVMELREATGPMSVPEDFTGEVLRRADLIDGRILMDPTPVANETNQSGGRGTGLAWGVFAAAALLGSFWAGTQLERTRQHAEPVRITAASEGIPNSPALAQGPQVAEAHTDANTTTMNDGSAQGASTWTAGAATPQAITPSKRPEPIHDVAGEIRDLLKEEIGRNDACPVHSNEPVTVTMTIDRSGTLTDRQLLSMATDRSAHSCVGYALDALLLPPLAGDVTVTFTIDW